MQKRLTEFRGFVIMFTKKRFSFHREQSETVSELDKIPAYGRVCFEVLENVVMLSDTFIFVGV